MDSKHIPFITHVLATMRSISVCVFLNISTWIKWLLHAVGAKQESMVTQYN